MASMAGRVNRWWSAGGFWFYRLLGLWGWRGLKIEEYKSIKLEDEIIILEDETIKLVD